MVKTIFSLFLAAVLSGCTTPALQRHAINQALSVTDIRYQEIMQGLAVAAHNGGVLPSIAVNSGGTVTVANTVGIDSATTWDTAVTGFSKQILNLSGKHAPSEQWTVAPVAAEPNLAALHAAFGWVLYGPPEDGSVAMELLRAPAHSDETGYHFDVEKDLRVLPAGWLKCGRPCDVPSTARYQAQCGDTFVWVNPDGIAGLSEFTLIVMDIATTDPTSLAYQPLVASVDVVNLNDSFEKPKDPLNPTPKELTLAPITVTEIRGVRQIDQKTIEIQEKRILESDMVPRLAPADVKFPTPGEVQKFNSVKSGF